MKEKQRVKKAPKRDYFYELTATITILITLVLFSELGMVGQTLKKLSKILFGDYYFVLVIFFFLHGVYALIKHKWFDKTSIRFNGFILFFTTLVLIAHLPFYEQLAIKPTDTLSKTIQLYQDHIAGGIVLKTYGGGIVGALLLQIFLVLFQKTGTILIASVFFILSLSFMTNVSLKALIFRSGDEIKKIKANAFKVIGYFKNIKYPETKTKKQASLNLNLLSDINEAEDSLIQRKVALELKDKINQKLITNNFYIKEAKMFIGYQVTRIEFYGDFRKTPLPILNDIIKDDPIIYLTSLSLIFEFKNKIKRLLTLKSLLLKANLNAIPLGEEVSGEVITFDILKHKHIYLLASPGSGAKNFLKCFIVSSIFTYSNNYLCLIDLANDFPELKYLPNLITPYINIESKVALKLEELSAELEKRLALLANYNVTDYLELNKKLIDSEVDTINPLFIIINGKITEYEKLSYFLKFGAKVGISVIYVAKQAINKTLLADFPAKIVLKIASLDYSYATIESHNACLLQANGDSIFLAGNTNRRMQLPFISNDDYKKVISKFIAY